MAPIVLKKKPLRILVISMAGEPPKARADTGKGTDSEEEEEEEEEEEDDPYSQAVLKILDRDRDNRMSWANPFTDTRRSKTGPVPQEEACQVETVCISWLQLPAHSVTAQEVRFTFLCHPGSQLKIDQGTSKTEGLGAFDGLVVVGTELDAQDESGLAARARALCFLSDPTFSLPFFGINLAHTLQAHPLLLNRDRDHPPPAPQTGTPSGPGGLGRTAVDKDKDKDGNSPGGGGTGVLNSPFLAELGEGKVFIVKDDPIFAGLGKIVTLAAFDKSTRGARRAPQEAQTCVGLSLTVRQCHKTSISLPSGWEALAVSDIKGYESEKAMGIEGKEGNAAEMAVLPVTAGLQMMRDKRKNMFYTCQFHPEVHNAQLLSNFIDLIESPPERPTYQEVDGKGEGEGEEGRPAASPRMFVTEEE